MPVQGVDSSPGVLPGAGSTYTPPAQYWGNPAQAAPSAPPPPRPPSSPSGSYPGLSSPGSVAGSGFAAGGGGTPYATAGAAPGSIAFPVLPGGGQKMGGTGVDTPAAIAAQNKALQAPGQNMKLSDLFGAGTNLLGGGPAGGIPRDIFGQVPFGNMNPMGGGRRQGLFDADVAGQGNQQPIDAQLPPVPTVPGQAPPPQGDQQGGGDNNQPDYGAAGPFTGAGVFTAWDPMSALKFQGKASWVAVKLGSVTAEQVQALKNAGFQVVGWTDRAQPSDAAAINSLGLSGYIAQAEVPSEFAAAQAVGNNISVPKALVGNLNDYGQAYPPGWIAMPEAYQNANPNATVSNVVNDARGRGAATVVPIMGTYGGANGNSPVAVDQYAAQVNQAGVQGAGAYLAEETQQGDINAMSQLNFMGGGQYPSTQSSATGAPPPPPPPSGSLAEQLAALNPSGSSSLAPGGNVGQPLPAGMQPSSSGGPPPGQSQTQQSNDNALPPAVSGNPGVQAALGDQAASNAEADAALRQAYERATIDYGDPTYAAQLAAQYNLPAGSALTAADIAAARANTAAGNSALARLQKQRDLNQQAVVNALAARGILGSGDLGYRSGLVNTAYGNQLYDSQKALGDYLTQLYNTWVANRGAARDKLTAAIMAVPYDPNAAVAQNAANWQWPSNMFGPAGSASNIPFQPATWLTGSAQRRTQPGATYRGI